MIPMKPYRFPMKISRLLPVGLGLILGAIIGCAHPDQTGNMKKLPVVPAKWSAPGNYSHKEVSLDWLAQFDDPRLVKLVREALEHNYDLEMTAVSIRGARAEARLAGAPRWPSIEAGASAQHSESPVTLYDHVKIEDSQSYGVTMAISWELDLWGSLKDRSAAAVHEAEAAKADWQAAGLSLAGQMVKTWYQIIADALLFDLIDETLESYRIHARLIRNRFESGLAGALDLRLALANVAATEVLLHERRDQLSRSKRHLQMLLQRYPDGHIEAPQSLPLLESPVPAGLPPQLLERRPDIRAAWQRLVAADLNISVARKAFLPQIKLTGDAGTSSTALENTLDTDYRFWNLIANLTQPIFQGGRLQANLDLSGTSADRARLRYAKTVFTAFWEVEQALSADHYLNLRIQALRTAVDQAEGAETLAKEAYASGLADIITLLEAQRRSLDYKADLITVRRQYIQNRVDIHLALGGGFHLPGENQ